MREITFMATVPVRARVRAVYEHRTDGTRRKWWTHIEVKDVELDARNSPEMVAAMKKRGDDIIQQEDPCPKTERAGGDIPEDWLQ